MQTFERSVLIVALLILIVTLAVMGIALKQNAGKGPSPPAQCPDQLCPLRQNVGAETLFLKKETI